MIGFRLYQMKPKYYQAVRYAKDTSNRGILNQHTLISERNDSVNLILTTPHGNVAVEPGDWIVKMENDFYKFTDEEFRTKFDTER